MLLKFADRALIQSYCEFRTGSPEELGCAVLLEGEFCEILIQENLPKRIKDHLIRHERAHCAGWPADHPMD